MSTDTKSTTQFTPGPWQIHSAYPIDAEPNAVEGSEEYHPGVVWAAWSTKISVGKKIIGDVQFSTAQNGGFPTVTNLAEARANARLIAAAPEMYAALQAALKMIDEITAQASSCMSHVGVLPRQQDWVRSEMVSYASHLRKPIDAAIAKAVSA